MSDKNFEKSIKILNALKVNYWICHGTLLGIYRDKKLLDWDNDIDFGIYCDDKTKKKVKRIFKKKGFIKKKKYFANDGLTTFVNNQGKEIDLNFYKLSKKKNYSNMIYIYWYVPKNILCKLIDFFSNSKNYQYKFFFFINNFKFVGKIFKFFKKKLIKKKLFFDQVGYAHPLELILKKKKIKFDNLKILIPSKTVEYLRYLYGDDWRIPKKKFVWYKDSAAIIKKNEQ